MKNNGLSKNTVLFSIMISLPLILIILPCAAQAMTSLEWIRVQGNRFVNESGETVIFRGVNICDPHELAGQGHWTRSHFAEAQHWGANVPVKGDETYGNALVEYAAEKGISWVAWCFDSAWAPTMFTDWDYTPTRQGAFFRNVMTGLVPQSTLDSGGGRLEVTSKVAMQPDTGAVDANSIAIRFEPKNANGIYGVPDPLAVTVHIKNKTASSHELEATFELVNDRVDSVQVFERLDATVQVEAQGQTSRTIRFTPPGPGFYHVVCTLNESVKKAMVLGYEPEKIVSPLTREADFDAFWKERKQELSGIAPQFKVTKSDKSTDRVDVYLETAQWAHDNYPKLMTVNPGLTFAGINRLLSYFDTMNLAEWITCPVLMSVGLQDDVCPPRTSFAPYNAVTSRKDYRVYPFSGHGVWREHGGLKDQWMSTMLGIDSLGETE